MLDEKLQTIALVSQIKERMELEDMKGWDNINTEVLSEADFKKFSEMKKHALEFLRNIDSVLLRVRMQVLHQQKLNAGEVDEFFVEKDPQTGLKKITTIQDKEIKIQSGTQIQQNIDQYNKMVYHGLAKLELLQRTEQELKDKIYKAEKENNAKEVAIKTQIYQLRILDNYMDALDKRMDPDGDKNPETMSAKNSIQSFIVDTAGQKPVKAQEFDEKRKLLKDVLSDFNRQIESGFNPQIVSVQQSERLDLASAQTAKVQSEFAKQMVELEQRMRGETDSVNYWMTFIAFLAFSILVANQLVQYGSLREVESQSRNFTEFFKKSSEILGQKFQANQ